MSLTRKMLEAMSIDETKIGEIINAHTEVTDSLKAELKAAEEQLQTLDEVTKERDELKARVDGDKSAERIAELEKEIEGFKAEKATAAKREAYTELLKAASIDEKRFKGILKLTDLSAIDLDENGKIKDADKITERVKADFADFIVTKETKPHEPATPPAKTDPEKDLFIEGFDGK